jgi:hypothetical protein
MPLILKDTFQGSSPLSMNLKTSNSSKRNYPESIMEMLIIGCLKMIQKTKGLNK